MEIHKCQQCGKITMKVIKCKRCDRMVCLGCFYSEKGVCSECIIIAFNEQYNQPNKYKLVTVLALMVLIPFSIGVNAETIWDNGDQCGIWLINGSCETTIISTVAAQQNAAGNSSDIQFNDLGYFRGTDSFVYDRTNGVMTIKNAYYPSNFYTEFGSNKIIWNTGLQVGTLLVADEIGIADNSDRLIAVEDTESSNTYTFANGLIKANANTNVIDIDTILKLGDVAGAGAGLTDNAGSPIATTNQNNYYRFANDFYTINTTSKVMQFSAKSSNTVNVNGNITAENICYTNGTNCLSSYNNPFDQNLNSTRNVTFAKINLSNSGANEITFYSPTETHTFGLDTSGAIGTMFLQTSGYFQYKSSLSFRINSTSNGNVSSVELYDKSINTPSGYFGTRNGQGYFQGRVQPFRMEQFGGSLGQVAMGFLSVNRATTPTSGYYVQFDGASLFTKKLDLTANINTTQNISALNYKDFNGNIGISGVYNYTNRTGGTCTQQFSQGLLMSAVNCN
jgi:hypothetical protein